MINPYWELVILLCLIHVICTISLNLVLGYNGQFSLGHAGFIAVGAYTSGVLTASFGWPLWAGIVCAMLLSTVAAVIIGYPCLRLRGDYLAIATLGFAEIIRIVLLALPQETFGGPTGMGNVRSLKDYITLPASLNGLGNLVFTILFSLACVLLIVWGCWALANFAQRTLTKALPRGGYVRWVVLALICALLVWKARAVAGFFISTFQFDQCFSPRSFGSEQWVLFTLMALILGVLTWTVRNYLNSLPGRNVVAIREDEIAATNLGVNCAWLKLQNFMFASALAGLGGALMAHTLSLYKPLDFNFFKSVDILLMVVLGGMGSLTGSYVGAVSITLLPEVLRFLGRWRMVIYSLALILLMLFRPGGLLGSTEIGELVRAQLGRLGRADAKPAKPRQPAAGGGDA
jgi:ABC-type branched-subunit amino acid transport system permease subunit